MANTLDFTEHEVKVSGTKEQLLQLAYYLDEICAEGTWGDLAYKIKIELDEDFHREVGA